MTKNVTLSIVNDKIARKSDFYEFFELHLNGNGRFSY